MTQAHQGDRRDLFDFPEVAGLEEFGLVPPLPADAEAEVAAPLAADLAEPAESSAAPAAATPAAATPPAGAPVSMPSAPPENPDDVEIAPARPNPPVPAGVLDLDEDLFTFDEIFSLEEDPYFNGTLTLDGSPTNPIFLEDSAAAPVLEFGGLADADVDEEPVEAYQPAPRPVPPPGEPAVDLQQPTHPAPASEPAQTVETSPEPEPTLPETITPAPRPEPEPARAADVPEQTHTATERPATPAPQLMDAPAASTGTTTLDRGPRLLLPEDVPYSRTGERQRYVLALVACFLLVNTGIFFLAQQASSSFNSTMAEATGLLAEALADRTNDPAHASAPVAVPQIAHTIEEPAPSEDPLFQPENWVDPTNYANTHEFAVGNAKALLAEGRFEDARRLLNHVLANQARIPLKPSLREEIDYLIPLTYYEQGNATAPEEVQ